MGNNPKISVIVPVYKVEKYLDRCVESIVNQTYKNLEIILVDDGSPDNCPAMCDAWAEKDERIRVIHKENGGLSDARNAGMDIATGDYIGFVDSDDWIEPDMYQFLMNNILENDSDISRCGLFVEYEDEEDKQEQNSEFLSMRICDNTEYLKGLVQGGYVRGVVWNKLYKCSCIGDDRFMTADGASEDIMFNNRIALKVKSCVCEDRPLYHYVRRKGAITISEFGDGAFSIIRAMESFLEEYKENNDILPYCIKGYTDAAFTVLSGVITNQKCLDRYDYLRNGILRFKKQILFSGFYSEKDKFKMLLLWISPTIYNKVIKKIRNA